MNASHAANAESTRGGIVADYWALCDLQTALREGSVKAQKRWCSKLRCQELTGKWPAGCREPWVPDTFFRSPLIRALVIGRASGSSTVSTMLSALPGKGSMWPARPAGASSQQKKLSAGCFRLGRFVTLRFWGSGLCERSSCVGSLARSTTSTPVVCLVRAPDRVANLRIPVRSNAGRTFDDDDPPSLDRSRFPFALTLLCRCLFGGSRCRRWFGQSCCFGFRR